MSSLKESEVRTQNIDINSEPEEKSKWKILWQKHKSKLWDTLDKSPEERRVMFKVDWWILTYACLGYFLKTLDQTNFSNAYASGMKEDYGFKKNEYNLASATMFNIGYIIGQVPSQMVLTRVRYSIWLPTMELLWRIVCMCIAATPKSQHGIHVIYALRFLIGLFESTAYAGLIGLLGSWYTPLELGKRAGIFQISSSVSNMFSGYLQAALHKGMDGRLGLRSYQWLFIFDGIITIPIALYGYLSIPDSPANTKAWWLKPDQKELMRNKIAAAKRAPPKKLTWNSLKALFSSWPAYLFPACFICHVSAIRLYSYMNLWLKYKKFSVTKINTLPTAGYGIQIFCTIIMAWTSDAIHKRYPLIITFTTISAIGALILTIWPSSTSAMFAGWYLLFCETGCGILFMSWINETLAFSAEQRLVCIGLTQTLAFTFQAWLPLIIYNTGNAPFFGSGYPVAMSLFLAEGFGSLIIAYIIKKENAGFTWFFSRKYNDLKLVNKEQIKNDHIIDQDHMDIEQRA